MSHRACELDVSHPFTAHLGQGHLDATFLADHTAVLQALVLAAQALIVLHRTKDTSAEQSVPFWLERPVVDGLGFLHLAERPRADHFG